MRFRQFSDIVMFFRWKASLQWIEWEVYFEKTRSKKKGGKKEDLGKNISWDFMEFAKNGGVREAGYAPAGMWQETPEGLWYDLTRLASQGGRRI